ncbi:cation/H(+) antiporter [Nocardiaceae bacterium YC2-7]|uniref:Cation/H(+) antiporter n=1 Tax=Antrihabitans stalactiti TaxID=2584121 RepID=A0A848KD96_9NOCA|nr:cation/H(+) antiporter [Antrihabitans stalactiti]
MVKHSGAEVFAFVLIDIAVIIVVARLFGRAARFVRQPAVVGEIVAGIALGPSLLGALPGDLDGHLFPPDVVPYLKVLASLGLVLFMFIVGLELDVALIRGRGRTAGTISLLSIVFPFALGAAATLILHPLHDHVIGEGGKEKAVSMLALTLFMGVAMSITAFPVLARILADRKMHRTTVGVLALASAAVDDIIAWTLLAFVVAVVKGGSPLEVLKIVAMSAVFAVVMFTVVRPLLVRLLGWYKRAGRVTPDILAVVLVGVLVCAFITAKIGIHEIFGAFLFGAILPREGAHEMTQEILEKLEQMSVLLLLPLFFVVTGFGVNIVGLTGSAPLQLLLILAVAIGGKFIGAYGGARMQRMPRQQSGAIAILMNTRGLTELVILSVGKELGVLDTELFTMMVLMALITTALAEPLLRIVYPEKAIQRDIEAAAKSALGTEQKHRILVVVDGPPGVATERMLRLADAAIAGREPGEILLSRFLPAADHNPRGLELGAGALPDLVGMAEAVEGLERFAHESGVTTRIKVLCRFSSEPGRDVQRQIVTTDAEALVVSAEWTRRNKEAFDELDDVTVLVVSSELPDVWFGSGTEAALALADGRLLVRDDGSGDARRAVLVAGRAALVRGAELIGVVSADAAKVKRKLTYSLEPLQTAGTAIAVVPLTDSSIAQNRITAAARVIDRTGGSEINLRDEITAVVDARVAQR